MIVLETERMVLRQMTMSDSENLRGIFADPEAMRYYPATKDEAETRSWIEWTLRSYAAHGFGLWVATLKATGEFAGQCGLTVQEVDGAQEVEVGYLFLRKLWGQNLATEAARACCDYGFAQLGLVRIVCLPDARNVGSRRVAEKVGMTLEREIVKWQKPVCLYTKMTPHS